MNFEVNIIQILTTVVTVGLAAIGGIWKLAEIKAGIEKTIGEIQVYIETTIGKVHSDIAVINTKLDERSKDILKVEAVADSLRTDFLKIVGRMQSVENNQAAMWDTLTKLFPDKVPKRPKDI